jgi:RNA polymerase sigma factor (sigma-70 family)
MAAPEPEAPSPAPEGETLTLLLRQAGEGSRPATEALARQFYAPDGYFDRLVRLVKGGLGPEHQAEDVVQTALNSFCLRLEKGEFPDLPNRNHLWAILVTITRRKAANAARAEGTRKRDHRRTQPLPGEGEGGPAPAAPGEGPARQAEEKDFLDWLFGTLPNRLRQVAELKLDGLKDADVAREVGVSPATVCRDLQTIRRTWRHLLGPLFEGLDGTDMPSTE